MQISHAIWTPERRNGLREELACLGKTQVQQVGWSDFVEQGAQALALRAQQEEFLPEAFAAVAVIWVVLFTLEKG
jgi:hypothetical protein